MKRTAPITALAVALVLSVPAVGQERPVAGEVDAEVRHPVALDKLLNLVDKKLDEDLIVALVEKDCVAFDVNAENVAELSKRIPKRVLQSAMDCRGRAISTMTVPQAPAASPVPRTPPPVPSGKEILAFFWKEAGARSVRFDRSKSGGATLEVERGGWPTCTAKLRLDADGITVSACSVMFKGEIAAESFPWEGIRSFCRESAKYETFIVHGSKRLGAIKFAERRSAEVLDATLRFAGAAPGGSCSD
jgi:hypothetical protein